MNLDFQWLFKVEETSQKSLLSHLQYIPCVSLNWSGSLAYFWTNYCMSAENVDIILSLLYGSFFFFFKLLTTLTFFYRFLHSGFSICGWFRLCSQVFQPEKPSLFLYFSSYLSSLRYLAQTGNFPCHSSISKVTFPVCVFFLIELSKFSSWFVEILYSRYTSFCWISVLWKVLTFHI